ncbi:MAG: hypothetical protein ABSG68_16840 [Thermoguttaceae bacterium]|jgi:hypothetical protein
MDIQEGDRVLVNVAPFIGSVRRHKESVPCQVLAVEAAQVHVCPEQPYREVSLWVARSWIERQAEGAVAAGHGSHEQHARSGPYSATTDHARRTLTLSVG